MARSRKGIVATLRKGVRNKLYPRGPRKFFFETKAQGAVEQAMCVMGFGCNEYNLDFGHMYREQDK